MHSGNLKRFFPRIFEILKIFMTHFKNTERSSWPGVDPNSLAGMHFIVTAQIFSYLGQENPTRTPVLGNLIRYCIVAFPPSQISPRKTGYIVAFPPENWLYSSLSPGEILLYSQISPFL